MGSELSWCHDEDEAFVFPNVGLSWILRRLRPVLAPVALLLIALISALGAGLTALLLLPASCIAGWALAEFVFIPEALKRHASGNRSVAWAGSLGAVLAVVAVPILLRTIGEAAFLGVLANGCALMSSAIYFLWRSPQVRATEPPERTKF